MATHSRMNISKLVNRLGQHKPSRRSFLKYGLCSTLCSLVPSCRPSRPSGDPFRLRSQHSPFRLLDRARDAGICFQLGHHGHSPLNILETAGCGCAFLDFDNDGFLDVLLVGQPYCALYQNNRNGTFRECTKEAGLTVEGMFMGVAVGDYDNDGWPDVFLTGYGRNVLLHNHEGYFEDVTRGSGMEAVSPYDWATSATFTDLDRDGVLELVVGHYVTFTPHSLQTCRYGSVQAACPPFYYDPQFVRVFRYNHDNKFTDVTRMWGFDKGHGNNLGVAAADYDNDGWQDLYVANDGLAADLWHNRHTGFENVGLLSGTAYDANGNPQAGMGVDWGDYDNDGYLDLIVATFQDQPRALYHNEGNGLFKFVSYAAGLADTTQRLAFGVAWADFDLDGWLDLLFTNGHVQDTIYQFHPPATYRQTMQAFQNRRDGTFRDVSSEVGPAFLQPIVGRGLAIGDYDNDGKPDALVVDLEGHTLLLHNETPTSNLWLGLKLVGTKSNRDAIGTRIYLETSDTRQMREVQTGRSYLSACDPRVLFGLGTHNGTPVKLSVHWPSGKVDDISVSRFNRYITIREDSGTEE